MSGGFTRCAAGVPAFSAGGTTQLLPTSGAARLDRRSAAPGRRSGHEVSRATTGTGQQS